MIADLHKKYEELYLNYKKEYDAEANHESAIFMEDKLNLLRDIVNDLRDDLTETIPNTIFNDRSNGTWISYSIHQKNKLCLSCLFLQEALQDVLDIVANTPDKTLSHYAIEKSAKAVLAIIKTIS